MAKKAKIPKVTLSNLILRQLLQIGFDANEDQFSDKSARWVEIKKNNYTITISFDQRGNVIEDVELHEDILDVVDTKKLI